MRDHKRGWARRAAAGLSAAGLLIIGLQLAVASPAQAECYEWGCNIDETLDEPLDFFWGPYLPEPYGGYVEPISPGGVGDTGQTRVFQLNDEVVVKVNEGLAREACNNLLTGTNPVNGNNARTVWQKASVVKSNVPNPDSPDAPASTQQGASVNGTITTYPAFESLHGYDIAQYIAENNTLERLPTDDEIKAMAVLHEVAHLTGNLGHDPDGKGDELFNLLVLEKCFGINRIGM